MTVSYFFFLIPRYRSRLLENSIHNIHILPLTANRRILQFKYKPTANRRILKFKYNQQLTDIYCKYESDFLIKTKRKFSIFPGYGELLLSLKLRYLWEGINPSLPALSSISSHFGCSLVTGMTQ